MDTELEIDNLNKIIIQNNKNCNIIPSEESDYLFDLKNHLSYKLIGVEYTQAFKHGWDGVSYMMDKKGNFPLGLLSRVKSFLDNRNITYEVIDKRVPISLDKEFDISENLKELKLEPRDYQLAMVEAAYNNRKGIIRATTGSGKTLTAALMTAKFNKTTIIYVIGLDLLQQFHTVFKDVLKQPIGYIGNGVCDIQKINIASIWTIGKALDIKSKIIDEDDFDKEENISIINKINIQNLLKQTELHIFDECHSVTTDTIKEIYKIIDPKFIYGMSATPYRGDGSDLLVNGILGEQIINISASDLIRKKILAQPIIKFINVPPIPIYSKTYASVYNEYIVENDIRNDLILKETQKLVQKGYQVLVLFKQIKHGKLLFDLFKDNNINCDILHGSHKLDHREEVKSKLLNKELDVIIASVIFDIGINLPTLSALILASAGRSSVRALQRIGRILRMYPGKTYAAVVDFIDNARFLKAHSQARYKIYSSEKGFIIKCPPIQKKK